MQSADPFPARESLLSIFEYNRIRCAALWSGGEVQATSGNLNLPRTDRGRMEMGIVRLVALIVTKISFETIETIARPCMVDLDSCQWR